MNQTLPNFSHLSLSQARGSRSAYFLAVRRVYGSEFFYNCAAGSTQSRAIRSRIATSPIHFEQRLHQELHEAGSVLAWKAVDGSFHERRIIATHSRLRLPSAQTKARASPIQISRLRIERAEAGAPASDALA
jgi:hypothetical protein